MKSTAFIVIAVVAATRLAHADPDGTPVGDPPKPLRSLHAEGARIMAEMEAGGRLPGVSSIMMVEFGGPSFAWMPRGRAAALNAGATAATLIGEMLLAFGSPLAAVGALATGATLDAAAADADRDAEARRPAR